MLFRREQPWHGQAPQAPSPSQTVQHLQTYSQAILCNSVGLSCKILKNRQNIYLATRTDSKSVCKIAQTEQLKWWKSYLNFNLNSVVEIWRVYSVLQVWLWPSEHFFNKLWRPFLAYTESEIGQTEIKIIFLLNWDVQSFYGQRTCQFSLSMK